MDSTVTGIVGCAGLPPTVAAIEAGKNICLANKETLIAGGPAIVPLAVKHGVKILPADSEHSAIFQCIQGLPENALRRIILTASGGAFRDVPYEEMLRCATEDPAFLQKKATTHPNWDMGAKITCDSATLMNKALEVIEAHYLYGTSYDNIDVVIHPQSIIHSMVETADSSVLAQLPGQLRGNIVASIYKDTLLKAPLFSSCSLECAKSLLLRLQSICSCLSHYSPVFAESPVVPGMVFPFVKAFKTNEVQAFEAFLTLVNNHARGWFELFPDPPYGHLAEVEAVVKFHDPQVAKRMESVPGGLQGAVWQLLSTLFTDVTTADEWLRLFDHVAVQGRAMLTHLAAAYVLIWRDAILNAPEGSSAVKQLFARDAGTSLERLLEKAYLLKESSPAGMTTLEPTKIVDVGANAPGDARPGFESLESGAVVELPKATTYPVFEGFPKRAVDYAAGERDRLRAEEDALLARQKTVKSLQKRTEEIQAMEMAWEAEAQRMDEIETSRRAELDQIDSSMKAEQKKWEERERIERLKQVEVIESAYASALARKKSEWNAELLKLKKEVDEKRELHAKTMKRQGEDEQLRTLEFQAQQRLWALEEERAHASALDLSLIHI